VDYSASWAQAPRAARRLRGGPARPGLRRLPRRGGAALEDFCAYAALAEQFGPRAAWPAGFAHPGDAGMAAFRAGQAESIAFHAFLQFIGERQCAAAAAATENGLYRDLAVGPAPDGAEVWAQPGAFLRGFSVGAPPDPFAAQGQVWGLPAPDPLASEAAGHRGFAALLAANMRHARALRLDHAMGLERLFVMPEGARAAEGCYLRQDSAGLLAALARASREAGCCVVARRWAPCPRASSRGWRAPACWPIACCGSSGEGEGLPPPRALALHAAACVSTHDLAPAGRLVGGRRTSPSAPRSACGRRGAGEGRPRRGPRGARRRCGIGDQPYGGRSAAAVHGFVAATPCALMLTPGRGPGGERIGVNLPGPIASGSNWRPAACHGGRCAHRRPLAQPSWTPCGNRGGSPGGAAASLGRAEMPARTKAGASAASAGEWKMPRRPGPGVRRIPFPAARSRGSCGRRPPGLPPRPRRRRAARAPGRARLAP